MGYGVGLADSVTQSVESVERSLASLERLLTPDEIETATRLERSIDGTAASTTELVDHLYRRGLQLAAIVLVGWFVLAVCLKVIGRRLTKPV